jgi:hypothetical protein
MEEVAAQMMEEMFPDDGRNLIKILPYNLTEVTPMRGLDPDGIVFSNSQSLRYRQTHLDPRNGYPNKFRNSRVKGCILYLHSLQMGSTDPC